MQILLEFTKSTNQTMMLESRLPVAHTLVSAGWHAMHLTKFVCTFSAAPSNDVTWNVNVTDGGCNNSDPSSSSVNSVCSVPSLIAVHAEDLAAIAGILRVVIAAKPSRETVANASDSFDQTSKQVIGWLWGVIVVNTELLYMELMLTLQSTEQDIIM